MGRTGRPPIRPYRATTLAIAIAFLSAALLFSLSSYSFAGSESYTIPAPACTYARSFASTIVRIVMHESKLPEKPAYPTAPAYGPARVG